jgi:hypothetical protein
VGRKVVGGEAAGEPGRAEEDEIELALTLHETAILAGQGQFARGTGAADDQSTTTTPVSRAPHSTFSLYKCQPKVKETDPSNAEFPGICGKRSGVELNLAAPSSTRKCPHLLAVTVALE